MVGKWCKSLFSCKIKSKHFYLHAKLNRILDQFKMSWANERGTRYIAIVIICFCNRVGKSYLDNYPFLKLHKECGRYKEVIVQIGNISVKKIEKINLFLGLCKRSENVFFVFRIIKR